MEIAWGTSKSWDALLKDQDDQPVDPAGKTLTFMAKKKITDSDANAVFTLTEASGIVVPGNSGANSARIDIEPEHTTALPRATKSTLHYQFLLIDGADRYQLDAGTLIVKPSVIEG